MVSTASIYESLAGYIVELEVTCSECNLSLGAPYLSRVVRFYCITAR